MHLQPFETLMTQHLSPYTFDTESTADRMYGLPQLYSSLILFEGEIQLRVELNPHIPSVVDYRYKRNRT